MPCSDTRLFGGKEILMNNCTSHVLPLLAITHFSSARFTLNDRKCEWARQILSAYMC